MQGRMAEILQELAGMRSSLIAFNVLLLLTLILSEILEVPFVHLSASVNVGKFYVCHFHITYRTVLN